MPQYLKYFTLMIITLFTLTSCAPKIGGSNVGSQSAGSLSRIEYGTVTAIQVVTVHSDSSAGELIGAGGGAVLGGILGSLVGGGTGKTLATAGGAILGGLAGFGTGKAVTNQNGYQIDILLENNSQISIVQGTDYSFGVGQKVKIIYNGNKARVMPL